MLGKANEISTRIIERRAMNGLIGTLSDSINMWLSQMRDIEIIDIKLIDETSALVIFKTNESL